MYWVSLSETCYRSLYPPASKLCPEFRDHGRTTQEERVVHKLGLRSLPSVCNAGRGLFGPLEAHELNAVGAVLDVNVLGTIRMLQAFLPDMKRRHSGRVLVTASVGGLMGERKGQSKGFRVQWGAAGPLQPSFPF